MEQEKTQFDLNKYLRLILKGKWFIIIPTIVFSIGAVIYAKRLPDIYESKCILVVKKSRVMTDVLANRNTRMDSRNILQAVREKMLSWESVTKVIKSVGLDKKDGVNENDNMERVYRAALNNISLKTSGQDNIMVSYKGKDPVVNFKIVDGLVSSFMELSRKAARTDADETLLFIEDDLARLKKHLDESERAFRMFEEEHIEELPGNENSILPKFYAAKDELREVDRQIAALGEELKFLREHKKGESKTITGEIVQIPNPKLDELAKLATDLEIEIIMLRAKYFDEHPAIKKRQDELVRVKDMLEKESVKVVSQEKIVNNPVYGSMLEKEFSLRLKLKSLQSRQNEIQNEIKRFQPTIGNIPHLKQRLYELQSTYGVNKALYEERLTQKSKAELVKMLSSEDKNDPFQIVEPARISYQPLKNEKQKIVAMGIVLGAGLGIGLVLGLDFIDPKFKSSDEIAEYLNIPVLGTIPTILPKTDVKEG